jgi:tetratricopeptide (TPR) repeat protein
MQQLYKEAVGMSKDPLKTSRLYRDFGFSLYLGSHEETKEAIKHYEKSKGLLSQIDPKTKPLLEEAELLSLYALAYRRVYQIEKACEYALHAREAIPKEIRDQFGSVYQNLSSLKYRNKELDDRQKSNLGNILRRLANTYNDLVSDPTTLSIAIRIGKDSWKMEDVENKLLEEAFQSIITSDKELQSSVGNIRERFQSENVLGLIATKQGKVEKAKQAHERSKRDAFMLNWTNWEYAQACRNLGLALEKEGNLDRAIECLEEAREKFRRAGDKLTTNWHIGRIRIKKGDAKGIFVIEGFKRDPNDWHWKGNDLVLLGIGYHDLLKNKEKEARKFFEQMLKLYEDRENIEIKSRAYGIDNALANVKSTHLRLCSTNGTHKEDDLCKRLQDQQARLEKMREEELKVIASFFSQS